MSFDTDAISDNLQKFKALVYNSTVWKPKLKRKSVKEVTCIRKKCGKKILKIDAVSRTRGKVRKTTVYYCKECASQNLK